MKYPSPTFAAGRIALCLGGLFGLLGGAGCAPMSFLITPVSGSRALHEHVVQRDSVWASRRIAIVDIEGTITNAVTSSVLGAVSRNPVALFREKLDKAARDKRVKAVVLRINSPGGGVTASDLMYQEVMRFKKTSGKPVIAALMDVAASGGYYVACAADAIYAQPTSVTGSIGVIMITPDLSGAMQKLGIRTNVFKSAARKDAGSPFRAMTEQDKAVYQEIISRMYARFLDVVAASRTGLTREQVARLADGRVYFASVAKENGLIDEIGDLPAALGRAKHDAGIADSKVVVVEYAISTAHRPNIYADAPARAPSVNLIKFELPAPFNSSGARFLYLWTPGW